MIVTLHEFLNSNRKYISAIYTPETQKNLRNWCEENDFDLSIDYNGNKQKTEDFIFHTTIWYTETLHDAPNSTIIDLNEYNNVLNLSPFSCKPIGFALLGDNNDIPVLSVKSKTLNFIRKSYSNIYKMRDKWSKFNPHISLTYEKTDDIIEKINDIKLPDFDLVIDKIIIENIV